LSNIAYDYRKVVNKQVQTVTEKLSDFIRSNQTIDGSVNTLDFIKNTISDTYSRVENDVNTKKSISANADPGDTQVGTFKLINPSMVLKIKRYFTPGFNILNLRDNTDYDNYEDAYTDAYAAVKGSAKSTIIQKLLSIRDQQFNADSQTLPPAPNEDNSSARQNNVDTHKGSRQNSSNTSRGTNKNSDSGD
jgi:hypothetical protein